MIFDVCMTDSNKVAYIILPDGIQDDLKKWMNYAVGLYKCSIVCIWGVDWANDLSPWIAEGITRKDPPFRGHAAFFLKNFVKDHIKSLETELKVTNPERTLVGVSLSGLFAVWASHNTDAFRNIISISGSLWYDGFVNWKRSNVVNQAVKRMYLSLGDKEKKVKEPRFANVQDATEEVVKCLEKEAPEVKYVLERNVMHFSPLIPRLDKAFEFAFAPDRVGGDGDED